MDARLVIDHAHPALALRLVPQTPVQRPGLAPVAAVEEAARYGAGPQRAWLVGVGDLQRPDQLQAGRVGFVGVNPCVGGGRDLGPARPAVVAALELDAEMAVVERRIDRPVARVGQRHADGCAHEGGALDGPLARAVTAELEQSLAGGGEQPVGHGFLPRVPSSAARERLEDVDVARRRERQA